MLLLAACPTWIYSTYSRRCVVRWGRLVRWSLHLLFASSTSGIVINRVPLQSLTTTNYRRTYTSTLIPSSMWKIQATVSGYGTHLPNGLYKMAVSGIRTNNLLIDRTAHSTADLSPLIEISPYSCYRLSLSISATYENKNYKNCYNFQFLYNETKIWMWIRCTWLH